MIYEETKHLTELDARSKGEAFKAEWGWGYGADYKVFQHGDVWVCYTSRYSSCD